MLASGVGLKVVRELLGHSKISTTAGAYTKVLDQTRPALSRTARLMAHPPCHNDHGCCSSSMLVLRCPPSRGNQSNRHFRPASYSNSYPRPRTVEVERSSPPAPPPVFKSPFNDAGRLGGRRPTNAPSGKVVQMGWIQRRRQLSRRRCWPQEHDEPGGVGCIPSLRLDAPLAACLATIARPCVRQAEDASARPSPQPTSR
jgi:hypothetical protein